jgi:regulator of RNase E activity RraA
MPTIDPEHLMAVTSLLLNQLRSFDTPTICNAVEMFEVRPRERGYGDGTVHAAFPEMAAVVGLACTATFHSGVSQPGGDPYGKVEALLEMLGAADLPTIVVIEDHDKPPVGAIFGEVMCSIYQQLGALGLITSGAGRDLDQVRALGFPVFVGRNMAAHAYCHAVAAGEPVQVAGLEVCHGDVMHADANGFATIPLEVIDEVGDVAAEYMRCERIVLEACRSGRKSAHELTSARREMIDGLKQIRQRVSRRKTSHQ